LQLAGNLIAGIAFLLLVSQYVYHVVTYIGFPLLVLGIVIIVWAQIEKKKFEQENQLLPVAIAEEGKEGPSDEQ
jgi:uncharacterized membrane protein